MQPWSDEGRDRISERIVGQPWLVVRHAVLHGQIVGEQDVRLVHDRLAGLFGCDSAAVLGILGISRSHKARARMTVDLLDRVALATDTFARVERLIGTSTAQRWLTVRRDASGSLRGTELLRSRVGTQYLGTVLTGLEDGAFR